MTAHTCVRSLIFLKKTVPWAWLILKLSAKKRGFRGTLGTMAKSATEHSKKRKASWLYKK